MKTYIFYLLSIFLILEANAAATKPNFIIILADDLGYGDITCYGSKTPTPHLDQLAQEGMRFTDFHSNGCVCTPSRAALLTGCYQQRSGLIAVLKPKSSSGLSKKDYTFAQAMKSDGYATAHFGKWHLGDEVASNPTLHGFDEYIGHLCGDINYFTHAKDGKLDWWNGIQLNDEKGYSTTLITDHAIDFIQRKKGNPFCLYVGFNAVHYPIHDPATGKPDGKGESIYHKMVQSLDQSVGRLLQALKDQGLNENTIVFFSSDNGARGQTRGASCGPLRGFKYDLYEGGHRVPMIAHWPGHIPSGTTTDEVAMLMDVMPTMLDLAGISLPSDRKLDGITFAPLLLKQQKLPSRDLYWDFNRGQTAMRQGSWKIVITEGKPELFNLEKDLGEKVNLASREPERVQQMIKSFNAWKEQMSSAKR